jgi:hypothetical protein
MIFLLATVVCLAIGCWLAWWGPRKLYSGDPSSYLLGLLGILFFLAVGAEVGYVLTTWLPILGSIAWSKGLVVIVLLDCIAGMSMCLLYRWSMNSAMWKRLTPLVNQAIANDAWVRSVTMPPLPLHVKASQYVRFGEEGLRTLSHYRLSRE